GGTGAPATVTLPAGAAVGDRIAVTRSEPGTAPAVTLGGTPTVPRGFDACAGSGQWRAAAAGGGTGGARRVGRGAGP
ncbi:MAG: hypothetical protein OXC31_13430, partial [Spirochaetaceae bacterium]|nr:hypothetical protein [Spirochaetaceae bacterium]